MRSQGDQRVERMCALAGVSRASYYRHFRASQPRREEMVVRDRLQRLALAHHRNYGYRRLGVLLQREGLVVNHKRVLRLMGEDNLLCQRKRSFVPATTDSNHDLPIYPNLARRLLVTTVNQLWVADITYIRLEEEFAYLAILLDAFSRMTVGWAMADHLRTALVLEALDMALASRDTSGSALVHHSDRGVQYASKDYVARLEDNDILPSMSRVAYPYDNAKAESFIKTLKQEEVDGRLYRNLREAKASIGHFIEQVYNRQRLHSALDYLSPVEFEQTITTSGWAAAQQPSLMP